MQRAARRALTRITRVIERHPSVAFLFFAAVYISAVLAKSRSKPLWHDEIFTYYIADTPNLATTLQRGRIDLNPPLSYLLTHLSFKLFHASTLTCRLPEVVAFFLAMLFLFAFVKQRMGVLYGLLAAALLFLSPAGELAIEARPYAILLSSICLSILAWQKARQTGSERVLGLCLLVLGAAGMLLSHVFGLLAWAALAAGELARIIERKKIDWKPVLAWTLPLLSVLTYAPLFRNPSIVAFPPAFQPTLRLTAIFYIFQMDRQLAVLLLTGIAAFIVLGRTTFRGRGAWFLTRPEWVATLSLIVAPCALLAYLHHSHGAFFPRYGVMASVGMSILFAAAIGWWSRHDLRVALMASVIALLISGNLLAAVRGLPLLLQLLHLAQATEPIIQPCQVCALTASIDPNIPLVDASGITFTEMNFRESPATLNRIFYLTDPEASLKYAHATIFEGMPTEAAVFSLKARTTTYSDFIQQHRHFFVFGDIDYPEDWLLLKLKADGADVRMVGSVKEQYKDHQVYEVTLSGHL